MGIVFNYTNGCKNTDLLCWYEAKLSNLKLIIQLKQLFVFSNSTDIILLIRHVFKSFWWTNTVWVKMRWLKRQRSLFFNHFLFSKFFIIHFSFLQNEKYCTANCQLYRQDLRSLHWATVFWYHLNWYCYNTRWAQKCLYCTMAIPRQCWYCIAIDTGCIGDTKQYQLIPILLGIIKYC